MKKIDLITKIANRCGDDNIELSDVKEWFDDGWTTTTTTFRLNNDVCSSSGISWNVVSPSEQKTVHRISIETDKLVLYESSSHFSKIGSLPYGELERYCVFDKDFGEKFFKNFKLGSGIEVCNAEAISGSCSNIHRLNNLLTILVNMGYNINSRPSAAQDFKFIHMTKPIIS